MRNSTASAAARVAVVDRLLKPSVAVWAERIEQDQVKRVEVEAVVVAAFGRVLAAPIAI